MGDIHLPVEPPRLDAALFVFVETMAAVAQARAEQAGLELLRDVITDVWSRSQALRDQLPTLLDEDWDDPASQAAATLLALELMYVGYQHRNLLTEVTSAMVEEYADYFPNGSGATDVMSDKTKDDIEVALDSVEKLMSHLPRWLQRVLQVLMEAIKIFRP